MLSSLVAGSGARTAQSVLRLLFGYIAWLVLSLNSACYAESTLSMEEFNALEPKWASLENVAFQIEGRYSIFSPSRLRMEKCKLDFVFAGNFVSPVGDSKVILLKGHLEKREANLVFVVTDLQPQASDVSTFRTRRSKVPSAQPEEWYKLAAWGAHRASYYRDDALKAEAVAAYTQGVQAEHRNLNPVTAADLRRLALKLSDWSADPALQSEFHHEACRMDYNTILKNNREGDGELLTELKNRLPGTDQPLTKEDDPVRERYLKSPLAEFKTGDAEARKKYARTLYIEVLKHRILRDASPEGKNGFSIADRIESQLPEYQSLAPAYREKELEYQLNRVGSMTRKEMTALVAGFESLNKPEFLVQLKKRWLEETEKHVDPANASDWVELGEDYLSLLNDQDSAIRFYKKAYGVSPGTQAISDWLTEHELTLHGGEWLGKGEVPAQPEDPISAAVRAGIVQPGMTAEQVRSSLGMEPTRRTRIATSGHLQEWWLFKEHGLSIQFTRRRRQEAALVTKVTSLSSKSSSPKVEPIKPVGTQGF